MTMAETINIHAVKRHWPLIAGSLAGLFILYLLLKHRGSAGSSAAVSSSPNAGLQASADLANAQVNGQVAIAGYQASAQETAVAASLQASLAKTAAELSATNTRTAADVSIAANTNATQLAEVQNTNAAGVSTEQIRANAAVQQTAIQGATLSNLATTAASVKLAQTAAVDRQIGTLLRYSKHFSQDIKAIAPTIALETGQGGAAPGIAGANAAENIAKSPASTISAIGGAAGSILQGLFAGG